MSKNANIWERLITSLKNEYIFDSLVIKTKVSHWWFDTQNIFDPVPEMESNEAIENYLLRLDVRHALRYINMRLRYFPNFSVQRIEYSLNTQKLSKKKRKKLENYLSAARYRETLVFFKDQLQRQ